MSTRRLSTHSVILFMLATICSVLRVRLENFGSRFAKESRKNPFDPLADWLLLGFCPVAFSLSWDLAVSLTFAAKIFSAIVFMCFKYSAESGSTNLRALISMYCLSSTAFDSSASTLKNSFLKSI